MPGASAKQRANERQTAVAAVSPTYSPFEDTLGAAPFDATDEERMANCKRLDNPQTLTEPVRDARKRLLGAGGLVLGAWALI